MDFKGTPGEWYVVGEKYFTIESKNTDPKTVRTFPTIGTINTTFIDLEEAKANAKVIAAAPELLKSLQDAKIWLGNYRLKNELPTQELWEQMENSLIKALEG